MTDDDGHLEANDRFDEICPGNGADLRQSRHSERRLSFGRVGVMKTELPADIARSISLVKRLDEVRRTTEFANQRAKLRRPPMDLFSRGMADPKSKVALLASDSRFQNWALVVIVLNAVWIGIDEDHNYKGSGIPLVVFDVGEHIFGFCFTFEILVRILAYRKKADFFNDKHLRLWNIFDLCLVVMMVIEIWVLLILDADASTLGSLSVLRLLRLLRITRVFRMVPELGMMVKSMAAAARPMSRSFSTGVVAIRYVFAIILTNWAKGSEERLIKEVDGVPGFFDDMYGTIPKSMLTLWQVLVFDDTFSLIRATLSEGPACGALLLIFIMLGAFMILNILIGVICEIVSGTTETEKDKLLRERIVEVFDAMDVDGSGTLTENEFNAQAASRLQKLGVDEDVVAVAFQIIDSSGHGCIDQDEFVQMLLKMLHPPTTQDLLLLQKNLTMVQTLLAEYIQRASIRHQRLEAKLDSLRGRQGSAESTRFGSDRMSSTASLETREAVHQLLGEK
ncbi:hypothetical protein FOL46_003403 [Perkinsus olseni]|uniref:EF-hand domain-containing protein n=2 Tax=Perkinsus olseni TaxID=32597 RepID=A0A7J6MUD6_PEROL|nr:hypothetical protein FOL46_003403 [Perkinsus olseni]